MSYMDNVTGRRARMEQERYERNIALTALSFDAEHTVQIRCGVAVLCTVSEPAGPGGTPTVFHLYRENLNYRDTTDYDNPDNIVASFHVANYGGWVDDAWQAAMTAGYTYAVKRVVEELNKVKEPA